MVEAYETADGKTIDDPTSGYDPDRPFENRDPRLYYSILYPGATSFQPLVYGNFYNTLDPLINGVTNPDYLAGWPYWTMRCIKNIIPISRSDEQKYGINIMAIRLSEMYLTYAEAAVETGQNLDIGLQYINLIRKRVGMPPATQLTRELVRRERRVELAFEGLRYWDIARWDIGAQVLNGPVYGTRPETVNMTTGEVTWKSDEHFLLGTPRIFFPERKYLLPIPRSEIDISGMRQNDGY